MIDLDALLERQRVAFAAEPSRSAERRIDALHRLETALRGSRAAIETAISEDFGCRPREETALAEMLPLLAMLAQARRRVRVWMRPDRRAVAAAFRPGTASIEYRPLGTVGILSPWNYPLLLSLAPAVDALAAGNRILLKPSELAPRIAALIAEMVGSCFDADEFAVVTGGPELARALCGLPLDHLVFTGSTAIGREVMRAAADRLTPVTLELGGKSPAILCADAELGRAARSIARGKLFNAGQTCVAPDYVLAPDGEASAAAEGLALAMRRMHPTIAGNPDYAGIIAPRHRARIEAALAEAEAGGARLLRHPDPAPGDRRMPPVVVLDPPEGCALLTEEIFGPVLPVLRYNSIEAAIARVNAGPTPLAVYPYTRDAAVARQLLGAVRAGGATVNGTVLHAALPDLPFGGRGASGTGAVHGREGFRRLSHAQTVYRPGRFSGFEWLRPPYSRIGRVMLNRITR